MTSVACLIRTRVNRHGTTPFATVVKPLAFSSLTAKGDPELNLYPTDADAQWIQAQLIAQNVLDGLTGDITGGSTLYIAPASLVPADTVPFTLADGSTIPFPKGWNQSAVRYACRIGTQVFFTEK